MSESTTPPPPTTLASVMQHVLDDLIAKLSYQQVDQAHCLAEAYEALTRAQAMQRPVESGAAPATEYWRLLAGLAERLSGSMPALATSKAPASLYDDAMVRGLARAARLAPQASQDALARGAIELANRLGIDVEAQPGA